MSTENNSNEQNATSRRGPEPRFVWGLVAVVILCGILYAGCYQLNGSFAKLKNAKEQLAQLKSDNKNLQEKKAGLEKKLEELPKRKTEKAILESYPGARMVKETNGVEFAFRWCPAGTFTMGSPKNEQERDPKKETQHEVTLTKGFWMLETEVTVSMFQAFVNDSGYEYESKGNTPYGWTGSDGEPDPIYSWRNPGFSQDNNHPVTCVSWEDAIAFCKWLSTKIGLDITLPTEAQWEYACRAGSKSAYFWGDDLNGNRINSHGFPPSRTKTTGKYIGKTAPVGSYQPNIWGLYDMHGNVWEWCQDRYGDYPYPDTSVTDPSGPKTGKERVFRGGCWNYSAFYCRSACRSSGKPGIRFYNLGFRLTINQ